MDYEKNAAGDLKRTATVDSDVDVERNGADNRPAAPQRSVSKFSALGWQVSAERIAKPAPAHHQHIARKPVGGFDDSANTAAGAGSRSRSRAPFLAPVVARMDRVLPPYRRYCWGRMSRKALLIVIAAAFVTVVAVVVGVAVALSKRSGYIESTPS